MPQTTNVAIIIPTKEELQAYAALNASTREADFCKYLKRIRKSPATEVIADLSGQVFSGLELNDVDLGNIIASKHDARSTQFQDCRLQNTKFRSKTSMEGLEFTSCTMTGALFAADLSGVNFGIDSNISGINLREAYNIDKCIIHARCHVTEVDLGFPDLDTFRQHMSKKVQDQKRMRADNKTHQAEISRHQDNVPAAPDIETIPTEATNQGIALGLMPLMRGLWSAAKTALNTTVNAVGAATRVAGNVITATTVIGAAGPADEISLHKTSIDRIARENPKFSPTIRRINTDNVYPVSAEMVREWAENFQGIDKSQSQDMSLRDYIVLNDESENLNPNIIPHLEGLNLQGINFSGLDFGNAVISKCNFSDTKFNQCDLDSASLRDCNFSGAEFIETTARNADLTRCSFQGAKIDKASFRGARLMDTDFSCGGGDVSTEISNMDLSHSDMRSAQLDNAQIRFTSLDGANMQDVTGDGATLLNVSAEMANLSDIALPNVVMRDVRIADATAHNANFEGATFERVTMTDVVAPGIRLDDSTQLDTTYTRTDLSNGTMNGSTLGNVTIDESKIVKMYAQKTKTPSSLSEILETMALNDSAVDYPPELVAALEENRQKPISLVIANSDARGADFSGSHLVGPQISGTDMSHARIQNAVLEDASITNTNLHGANLSSANGGHTTLLRTHLEGVNATDSRMTGIEVRNGAWQNVDAQGADMTHATLGTNQAKLDMSGITSDIATNLAYTNVATVNPDAAITVVDGAKSTHVKPHELVATHTTQADIMVNTPTNILNAAGNQLAGATASAAEAANAAADTLEIPKKKSRMGLVVGILGGIVAGGMIAGIAASTFGLGLIPLSILAATTIGGCAIGGGVTGHLIQNTTMGKGVLAVATAGVSAMVLGPIGLIAAPAVALYNTITGKTSGLRRAFGSALRTMVATPLTRIANFVSSNTHSNEEIVAAQTASQSRKKRGDALKAEKDTALAPTQNNDHNQAIQVATQITSNEQTTAAAEQKKSKAKKPPKPQLSTDTPQPKTGWRGKVAKATTAIKSIIPKKKTSHTAALQEARTESPSTQRE